MSDDKSSPVVRKVLLAGDSTLDPLGRLLERGHQGLELRTCAAPYGQVYQILLDAQHPAWAFEPDILVVWTAPQLTLPSFAKLLRFEYESATTTYEDALREVEQFAAAVTRAAAYVELVFVPSWVLPSHERWIQTLTWRQGIGVAGLLAKANLILAERFASHPSIVMLDSGYWQVRIGRPAHDPRMYAVAKILYSQPFFEIAAAEMKAILRGSLGQSKKLIACDLDNTLWGGVVGDDGPQNIKLGAPDPVGECFHLFQTSLKALRSRGIMLAICSKNDEKFALSVIEEHPAMVLRKSDFVAWRINWEDKAKNLLGLAEELSLGLDSFVFLDDSPQERDQVRQVLPQVYTPDLPKSPADLASFVSALDCFETPGLGKEDFERTNMYHADRGRKEAFELSGDVENWLASLKIEVCAAPLRRERLARAAQLLNKTNQFNLTLRRLNEETLWAWAQEPCNLSYTFHVSDRFGDFGLAGLATLSVTGTEAQIVDFVMSCRVMGKKVEEAILGYVMAKASAAGASRVIAVPIEGPRNGPAKTFFGAKQATGCGAVIDPLRIATPAQICVREEI